ncbi:MAG: LexA family protein [Steroidobacteraceae bacterium]
MTPEQVCEFRRKAGQGRWRGLTADERSEVNRKLIERRWGQVAYAKNQEKADRLYAFLREYISAKRYAPTMREISHAMRQTRDIVKRLLQILERIGRIQRHAWRRGITLSPLGAQPPAVAFSFGGESTAQGSATIVVPRPTKKCYDCDDPAVAGKARCEQHLARVREACKRTLAKKRAMGRSQT